MFIDVSILWKFRNFPTVAKPVIYHFRKRNIELQWHCFSENYLWYQEIKELNRIREFVYAESNIIFREEKHNYFVIHLISYCHQWWPAAFHNFLLTNRSAITLLLDTVAFISLSPILLLPFLNPDSLIKNFFVFVFCIFCTCLPTLCIQQLAFFPLPFLITQKMWWRSEVP